LIIMFVIVFFLLNFSTYTCRSLCTGVSSSLQLIKLSKAEA
jgi:sulfite exporter TauE/SafE